MKLCDAIKLDIEGQVWEDFSAHYYCSYCSKMWHIWAKATSSINPSAIERKRDNWTHCPDCLNLVTKITDELIRISRETKKQGVLKFTDEERKEIFDDWNKHIKSIPTADNYRKIVKMRKKAHQTFASA